MELAFVIALIAALVFAGLWLNARKFGRLTYRENAVHDLNEAGVHCWVRVRDVYRPLGFWLRMTIRDRNEMVAAAERNRADLKLKTK